MAQAGVDDTASLNAALNEGWNLLFTPGIYQLNDTLQVTRPETIVYRIGLATLVPDHGGPAMRVADVDGVIIAGIVFDAGPIDSPTLLEVGEPGSSTDHSVNPTSLHDLFCRIGGGSVGTARSCVTINSHDVIGDYFWLWWADHGNDVTIYGLMVKHFQEYQTLWNGDGGRVYFYQSEIPFNPPDQASWSHDGGNGYASYKVADSVTSHEAWGLGVYCNFIHAPIQPATLLAHVIDTHPDINYVLTLSELLLASLLSTP